MYTFRKCRPDEVPTVFSLILSRIRWMDTQGIRQWNVTRYDTVYPMDYYADMCRRGCLFVLADDAGEILSAAVLKEQDDRWTDAAPALYLHNFVSKPGAKGAGTLFLEQAQDYARQTGKRYFRLDSAADNFALAAYYEARGFLPCGCCQDGDYHGILRQKML